MGVCHSSKDSVTQQSPLSLPLSKLKDAYDVVVIGSGYGGSIAALRCASMGLDVCLLEHGREWPIGSFPETAIGCLAEAHVDMHIGSDEKDDDDKTASLAGGASGGAKLFQLHVSRDMTVFTGSGLGGTSLINGNVAINPSDQVFEQRAWPRAIREEWNNSRLQKDQQMALDMLRPSVYPADYPPLPKVVRAFAHVADIEDLVVESKNNGIQRQDKDENKNDNKGRFYKPLLNVNFVDQRRNHVGVPQPACNNCGNCCTGCNTGAKNTLYMNYLPDAVRHGAQVFCQVRVSHIESLSSSLLSASKQRYRVHCSSPLLEDKAITIQAGYVFLGAGSLGSTEILLRSQKLGTLKSPLSPRLGLGFSGNGDCIAFGANAALQYASETSGQPDIAAGEKKDKAAASTRHRYTAPGPTIASILDYRPASSSKLSDQFVMEDVSVPYAFVSGFEALLTLATRNLPHTQRAAGFLMMSQDNARGQLRLDPRNHRIMVDWPDAGAERNFTVANQAAERAAKALNASFVPDPLWAHGQGLFQWWPGNKLITVHPLGGCCMSDSIKSGVVDHSCQVWNAPGLYVVDGAAIPCCLGVNPLLTICTVAERAMRLFVSNMVRDGDKSGKQES